MANQLKKMEGLLPKDSEGHSVGEVLKELGTTTRDLVQSEVELARAEFKESANHLTRHTAQGAIFGALFSLSVLPFLAFLVIGLGRILGDNYWLSSLIVAIACAVIGGPLAYRSFRKIQDRDLQEMKLPKTRESLEREAGVVSEKKENMKDAIDINRRRIS